MRGNTAKNSAAEHRAPGPPASPEGTVQQAAAPNERNKTTQHTTAQRAAARRSNAPRDTQHSTAQGTQHRAAATATARHKRGGGQQPPGSSKRPGWKHKRGESAQGGEKRDANKANNAQRRGPVSAASPICSDFQTFCPDWLHFGHSLCFGGIAASQLSLRIRPIYF